MDKPMPGAAGAVWSAGAVSSKTTKSPGRTPPNVGSVGGEGPGALAGAVGELRKQHPIKHDDLGPHHSDSTHVTHAPAVKPNSGHPYGRG